MHRPNRVLWLTIAALVIVPFVGLLWVPAYTRVDPILAGFPFFYWYQLAWVPLSAICTGLVYLLLRRHENGRAGKGDGGTSDDGASQ